MNPPRKPLDATVDSVTGAIALLWDWLGGPEPKQDLARSEPETRIPAVVIDTEGEDA